MTAERLFHSMLAQDARNERRIFWREVSIILVVALLVTAYLLAVSLRLGAPPMLRL
jgi:hypothetical protein